MKPLGRLIYLIIIIPLALLYGISIILLIPTHPIIWIFTGVSFERSKYVDMVVIGLPTIVYEWFTTKLKIN